MKDKFVIRYTNPNGSLKLIGLDIGKFPGGEIRVRLLDAPPKEVTLVAMLFSSDDIMTLAMITDALRIAGTTKIRLDMPYIPYARQDRVCNKGESFSLKVFAQFINSLKFSSIVVSDPHSDVATALIERVIVKSQADILKESAVVKHWLSEYTLMSIDHNTALKDYPTYLVSPDAGSLKKIYTVAKEVPYFSGIIFAEKIRDVATGNIIKTVVRDVPEDIANARLLIVDDICDGGRTFIELAKILKPQCKELNLFVTHGIFSKEMDVFDGLFDNVWSAYNFNDYKTI